MANKYVKSFNFGGDTLYPLPRVDNLQNGSVLRVVNGQWMVKEIDYVYVEPGLYDPEGTFTSWDDLVSSGMITLNDDGTSIIMLNVPEYEIIGDLIIPDSITSIGESAFENARDLANCIIPNSVTSIGDSAFCMSGLFYITIPDSVDNIGRYMFSECANLVYVVIPNSVTNIGEYAFDSCSNLTDVYYTGTEEQWAAIMIDNADNANDPLLNATIHYNYTGNGSELN